MPPSRRRTSWPRSSARKPCWRRSARSNRGAGVRERPSAAAPVACRLEGTHVNIVFARIDRAIELLLAIIFAAMCIVGLLQVFNRFVLNVSLSWSEEAQVFGHIWLVFLAIPIAYQRGAHLYVDEIRRK